jgi:hypothetical protein
VKRRLKLLLKIFLAICVLLFLFLLFEHVRGRILLARYQRELIAKGIKLDPHDFASPAANRDNGLPAVFDGSRRLTKGTALPDHYPPAMQITPSGHAMVGFREKEWVAYWDEGRPTNRWEEVAVELKTNAQALADIRAALEKPVLDSQLDYSQGFRLLITNLAPAKALTRWFGAGTQLALREGRNQEALEFLVSDIHLSRLLQSDRLLISELVRIAIASIAKTATWEALQAEGWTDEDLARIQQAWSDQEFCQSMAHGLEGDILYDDTGFALIRKSNDEAFHIYFGLEEYLPPEESERPFWERTLRKGPGGEAIAQFLKKQIYCRVWRFAWLDQAEHRSLEQMDRLLEITRTTPERSFTDVKPALEQFEIRAKDKNFYDRLRYPDTGFPIELSSVVKKALRAETDRSLTICAIALKRYSLRHGKPPASLAALVPEFLPSVPIDYMDGKPVKYHLNAGGSFTLYSVGEDGKDDGGDASAAPEHQDSASSWFRKDFVWPSAASPEEAEAYRNQAVKN